MGNCFINPIIENGVIKIEAVAQTVRDNRFPMFYKKGGHLKGNVSVVLRKTEYIGIQSKYEASQATIIVNGNQYNISGDVRSDSINLGEFTGDVFTSIEKQTYQTNQGDLIMSNDNRIQGIGEVNNSTIQGNAKIAGIINETISDTKGKSLAEAAAEIQQLLDQLSQTYPPEEAEQKVAEDLANKAKQDPSFKQSLKNWSQSLLGKGSETAVTETVKEGVKRVIPLAISFLI